MTDISSGDLFAVDKRLTLKPVRDFNAYLAAAFATGPCQCKRCQDSQGNEDGYEHAHTFNLVGGTHNIKFACTTGSDVQGALRKAWKSYTKEDLATPGPLDMDTVLAFTDSPWHERVRVLLDVSGAAAEVDGRLQLLDCTD